MEKDRNTKIISIVSMFIAVLCLSIGFAAFSRTLNIQSSATVNISKENFSVKLSQTPNSLVGGNMAGYVEVSPEETDARPSYDYEPVVADNESESPTLKGINATFTKPGQSVTYKGIYIVNDGQFDAILNGLSIANVDGQNSAVVCEAKEGTNADYVKEACKGIKMQITISSNDTFSPTPYIIAWATTEESYPGNYTPGAAMNIKANFGGNDSSDGEPHVLEVKLSYEDGSTVADGPFDVKFGNVSINYGTQIDS